MLDFYNNEWDADDKDRMIGDTYDMLEEDFCDIYDFSSIEDYPTKEQINAIINHLRVRFSEPTLSTPDFVAAYSCEIENWLDDTGAPECLYDIIFNKLS